MKAFKIFNKKKEGEVVKKEKPIKMTINGVDHTMENLSIKVQAAAEDVTIYGWTLEKRSKYNDTWSHWFTYYNNRIYQSKESAIDAAIKAGLGYHKDTQEYRVTPIYIMTNPQYREYKIERLLSKSSPKKTYEIKGWRLKEDYEWYKNTHTGTSVIHKKGTIYIQLENGDILKSGSCVEWQHRVGKNELFGKMIPNGLVEEVKIEDEKWLHPHLLKELKTKLKIK